MLPLLGNKLFQWIWALYISSLDPSLINAPNVDQWNKPSWVYWMVFLSLNDATNCGNNEKGGTVGEKFNGIYFRKRVGD